MDYLPLSPARKLSWWLDLTDNNPVDQFSQHIAVYVDDSSPPTKKALIDFSRELEELSSNELQGVRLFIFAETSHLRRWAKRTVSLVRNKILAIESTDHTAAFRDILSFCSTLLIVGDPEVEQIRHATERAHACGVIVHQMTSYRLKEHLVPRSRYLVNTRIARGAVVPSDIGKRRGEIYAENLSGHRPSRVLVASHDLKFADRIIKYLRQTGHEVRFDQWYGHSSHDTDLSEKLLVWADVIWCEWSLGNAVWYSRKKRPDQRLVIRFHAQELKTRFPSMTTWESVNVVIFVAQHIKQQSIRDFDVPAGKSLVIPNIVSTGSLTSNTPNEERRFHLALVGYVPKSKGLIQALSVLELLRKKDARYHLTLRGRGPHEYEWLSRRPDEQAYFELAFDMIRRNPMLRGAVRFSDFGNDMANFYASTGFVLSTSENESFHYTIPDGATHGAVPVSFRWAGSDLLYPRTWLGNDAEDLARSILQTNSSLHIWLKERQQAKEYVDSRFSEDIIVPKLTSLILGSRGKN